MFADTDLLALKEKEQSMRQKKENKYYRCKQRDAKLYEQIREAYLPHVTLAKIAMLNHPHHTQGNEAMNTSVMSYAPKSKTFCKTKSLETRVGIAAGVMILGYEKLWIRIFDALKLEMDTALLHSLQSRDVKKNRKAATQKTTTGKKRRRDGEYTRNNKRHAAQMHDLKTGKTYGAGVALATAKKVATKETSAAERNPQGTRLEDWKCPYFHPLYCTVRGHKSMANDQCGVHGKSKEELKSILAIIKADALQQALARVKGELLFYFVLSIIEFFLTNFNVHIELNWIYSLLCYIQETEPIKRVLVLRSGHVGTGLQRNQKK